MSESKEDLQTIRLYIGNISPQLASNISALEKRLNIFGKLQSSIEIKCKETFEGINNFGYVDILTDEERFKKLLSAFHKVNFMNSFLVIDKAKPSFQDLRPDIISKEIKQDSEIQKKLNKSEVKYKRIAMSQITKSLHPSQRYHDYFEVIAGCYRRTPRVKNPKRKINLNDISYRVKFKKFNAVTKKYENISRVCKLINSSKVKLWGYHKDKFSTDLVFRFQNGSWKDGNNHIVETNMNLKEGDIDADEEQFSVRVTNKEINQTKSVLNNLLTTFDFDKPAKFDWDTDRKEKLESNKNKFDYEAHNHAAIFADVDDDDEEIIQFEYDKPNKTEILKRLFNDQENSNYGNAEKSDGNGFAFGLANSDIEEDDEKSEEPEEQKYEKFNRFAGIQIIADQEQDQEDNSRMHKQLFFPHFESPFLVAQSQLNKLVRFNPEHSDVIESWKSSFEQNRVELMKKFKKRKRDFSRQGKSGR